MIVQNNSATRRNRFPMIAMIGEGQTAGLTGEDRPGADEKAPLCVYRIDKLVTRNPKKNAPGAK